MKYLSENEENCLRFLLNRPNNVGFGNDDKVYIKDISGEQFTFSHFQTLEKEGFLVGSIYTDVIQYYLTSKAVDYFSEKKKYIEVEKKEKKLVSKRYWMDKIIPFLALMISLIVLLNSIFKWW